MEENVQRKISSVNTNWSRNNSLPEKFSFPIHAFNFWLISEEFNLKLSNFNLVGTHLKLFQPNSLNEFIYK